METIKLKVSKDEKCSICKDPIFNEKGEKISEFMAAEFIGTVHQECFLPYYEKERMKIFLKIRCYSIGDTIAVTPIIREIKRLYPTTHLTVMTWFVDLFKHNPYVDTIFDANTEIPQQMVEDYTFVLDGFDESKGSHFAMHSVEFSSQSALGKKSLIPTEWDYDLFYSEEDKQTAIKIATEHGIDLEHDRCILIHPHGTEWPTRDWGPKHFPELAKEIQKRYPEYKLVSVGGKRVECPQREMKNYVHIEGAIDLFGKLTLLQSAALMDLPTFKMFVTPDTGSLHLAATRKELPIVAIFTLIKSYFRTPVRNRIFAYKFLGVEADSGCNCSYTNNWLSESRRINECPKKSFLQKTLRANIPKRFKEIGYKLYNVHSDDVRDEIKKLENELDCFPSVSKVMKAIERMMYEINRPR